jgi:hypothetical protein
MAEMEITACQLAKISFGRQILFDSIMVLGLLASYNTSTAELYCLEMDFAKRKSTFSHCFDCPS